MEIQETPDGFHQNQLSSAGEAHSQDSLRSLRPVSTSFATSFDRLPSFGNLYSEQEVRSKCLGYVKSIIVDNRCLRYVKRIVDKNPVLLQLWNEILVVLCVIATLLDPLFCYILLVDEDKRCVGFDNKLRIVAVIFRSITDFLYIILIVRHFQLEYFSFYNPNRDNSYDGVCTRAWRFFLSFFTVEYLAVLPLPQVMVSVVIPSFKAHKFIYAVRSLKYSLLIQYLPRVLRIYSFIKQVRWTSNILPEAAGAEAGFNLFLYMLASHVIGAFWYLFTVERKATCWRGRCQHCPLNCNYVLGNSSADSFCSAEAENGFKTFDFGIFKDALHIVDSKDFIKKISYCYWWGLQKLSSLGQDLKTSDHLWEIYFAVAISISGLVLFALLIGNLQEMRLKRLWMANHSLPTKLKKKIMKYELKCREAKIFNLEQFLHDLPKDLRRDTKRYLCWTSLSKVSKFQNVDNKLLDVICDYLKPVFYNERNYIVQEGEPVDEMVFIIRGKAMIFSKRDGEAVGTIVSGFMWLTKDDFYGDNLLEWALRNPISTKTVRAHSKVEAFVLKSDDLMTLISKFGFFN